MKKAIILLSAIMSVMTLTVMADEYIDPQTNVVYTYEPGQPTASVKAGCEMVVDMGLIDLCPGSPDAADDVVILDKFTVGTTEYVVTSIGEQAFWTNNNIKSVSIPESVTDIGVAAFENCDGLTAVQLPEGLIRISRKLFHNCSQLESVVIPSSIRSIDEQAFADCRSLASLTLPADLNYIGRYAFQNTPWYSTQYNEAPDGLFYIGPLLVGYKGNVPTGDLVIKEGTTCIGYQAFNYCTGLTSVTIPESLTHVDYRAFYNCVGLTAVHITDLAAWCKIEFQWDDVSSSSNPLFYAHHLYLNGEEMTDLVIPDGVTSICRYAFDNCTGLTSVIIPEGVTRISSEAFRSCGNLTSVTIPPSVTTIESYAFIWCFNLNAVHISDLAAWCGNSFHHSCLFAYGAHFYLKGEEVKDLVIPEGVAGIGNGTFEDYSYLTSVTIPKSVTTIGENAFNGCKNLTDVYCHADSVPSTEAWVFYDTPIASATLHVPAGSIEEYKTTSPWSGFGNIVALPIEINETTFPDEYFRNWVLAQPYGQDGVLTDEEIAGVTKINVMRREVIQSLKGIEYFTAITKLVCEMNQLTELDLSKNIKLTSLTCYGNQLTELNLSNNKELTYLACEGNELTTLDVSGFTKLKELDCQQNPMITLNVSGCSSLTTLKCYLNQLTELDVSGCAKLDTIWCEYNQLTELDVSSCTSLTFLWCEMNQLTKLDVTNNTKLRKLLANDNQLAALNLSENKLLQYLRTYNNQIKGKTMDALIENLPIVSHCGFCPVFRNDEVDVMNAAQVAAAKSKGFIPYYWNEEAMRWMEYTGEVPPEPITFTEGQMATIILPTEPEASKGKYYRLDRVEDGKIIFEQELHPQAHIPYIIVPNEDFSIDPNNMDLEGCSPDTVSIKVRFEGQAESQSIYFIGSYVSEELEQQEGCNIQLIDTTPDCSISFSEETGKRAFLVGALRAYLTWDDPYNQGGTKGRGDKLEIVLLDYGTSIEEMKNEELRMKNDVFDLSGKKLSDKPAHGLYIENGKKQAVR